MCGIFALLNYEKKYSIEFISQQFKKGKMRGPEDSQLCKVGCKSMFGFHRLAINGLTNESSQPLIRNNMILICNGEIYNYKRLYEQISTDKYTIIPSTQSDCEVILWLYEKYGIEHCLQMLDGVFSFILLDQRDKFDETRIFVARDPYGVRPLYSIHQNAEYGEKTIGFASELKVLSNFVTDYKEYSFTTEHFKPGTYSEYVYSNKVHASWELSRANVAYHLTPFCEFSYHSNSNKNDQLQNNYSSIVKNVQHFICEAVYKRCLTTERPIACLLSGGLDSSLITALVCEYHRKHGLQPVETYSIGLAESVDLYHAKLVATHLGTKHTEIILTEQNFIDAIPKVIKGIESYDTTTVRASIGNYLLGEYIAKHSDAKVIFNGDGSDELLGGYLYMKKAPTAVEFDKECRRLLTNIHAFDVLRSDKSISSHGLEPRTPFLDRAWVQYYLSILPELRWLPNEVEKYWLRHAFSPENFKPESGLESFLPDAVLWRKKEAFSDGVSSSDRSLYHILQEYCQIPVPLENYKTYEDRTKANLSNVKINWPKTAEQYYYRFIFETFYPGLGNVVPYFWMPKYVKATDASARTLDIYNEN
jgi:asparagine synthase (glutamine-hydrolysing)